MQPRASLDLLLKTLRLPTFQSQHDGLARCGEREGWSFDDYLYHLAEMELEDRRQRRVERLLKTSGLPFGKTMATLEMKRFSTTIRRLAPTLAEGGFVDRAENVLLFGLPGRGKTHLAAAIGHELALGGRAVLFTTTSSLVQKLLVAKRDLRLDAELRMLDRFEVVIIDDLGYVQKDQQEMEVLFTFLGERYERRSVMITCNLVFSQWDRIFNDTMMTACAIERLVHHATILELGGSSFRTDEAKRRNTGMTALEEPSASTAPGI
jgi:DNA replication protein DnaC